MCEQPLVRGDFRVLKHIKDKDKAPRLKDTCPMRLHNEIKAYLF